MKNHALWIALGLTGCTPGITTIESIEVRQNGGVIRAEGIKIQKDRAGEIARGIAEGLGAATAKAIKPL